MKELMPGLLSLDLSIVVLGKGSTDFGSYFTKLSKSEGHRIRIMKNDEAALHQMLAASDMALILSADQEDTLKNCLAYGTVPVSMEHPMLSDYNPVQESGNAFTFEEATMWKAYASLVRACETYKFPFDWKTIQKHCMEMGR